MTHQSRTVQAWAASLPPNTQVIFEHPAAGAAGTYSTRLTWVLAAQGIGFTALLASQSAGLLRQDPEEHQKSDPRDAFALTRYGQVNQPEPTPMGPESLHQLRQAQRYLHELRLQHQAATSPLHALSYDPRADGRIVASLELMAATLQTQTPVSSRVRIS